MTAFVLGNGQSRTTIDIDHLMTMGNVYGCNALYRTHTPTVLVATDVPISDLIQESGYSLKNRFYTRRPRNGTGAASVPKKYFGYSSGPIAAALAALDGHSTIYLLGFDMGPGTDGKFNNVYAGTEFYKTVDSVPTYTGNWIRQIMTICNDFPATNFVRVHGNTTADISEFSGVQNIKKLDLSDFVARINTPKDL